MSSLKKPNVFCRNCGKHYYACKYCLKTQKWRSYCCSEICHEEYIKKVLDERSKSNTIKNQTNNTLTEEEINQINSMTPEQALEQTKEDLKDYIEENPNKSLGEILDLVNSDIDKSKSKRKRKNT